MSKMILDILALKRDQRPITPAIIRGILWI